MTGAIASVACANGRVQHFVCVKKDGTLGHLIGTYDNDDNLTWSLGTLQGLAHPQSRIAIGCPNPTEDFAILDVVYQNIDNAIVSTVYREATGDWEDRVYRSDRVGTDVVCGTDLSVAYGEYGAQVNWQLQDGTMGVYTKDGIKIKLPLLARFHYTTVKRTTHFYYLDTTGDEHYIRHYAGASCHGFFDIREPQIVPYGTKDFRVVDDSVSIIDVTTTAGTVTKSSVRLLETWLNEDFHDWSDFSGPNTVVAADIGLTVFAKDTTKPSVFFTYVDSHTGTYISLSVRQGQSVGYESPIALAQGWFEGDTTATAPSGNVGYTLDVPTPVTDDKTNGNKPTDDVRSPKPPAPVDNTPLPPTGPIPAPINGSGPDKSSDDDEDFGIPEWIRKFCKDVLMPRASENVNKVVRKSGTRGHAVLAPLDKLWNLGSEPLKYKFLDGPFGGNEIQRQKVRDSIPEWSWYANIKFQEAKKGESAPIKITFDPNDGSWSVIGNDAWKEDEGSATMNLGWVKGNNKNLPKEERGVILHEWGHALGLLHEHQSPAHGGKSVPDPDATIKFYMKDQGWTEEMVLDQVIRTYNLNDVSNFSEVDTKSIMHYYQPAEVTGGEPIDYNYVFSERDKAYMVINYPRSLADERKNTSGSGYTLVAALKSVGLTDNDPTTANKIIALRDNAGKDGIDVGQIRRLFTAWAKAKHTVKDEKLEPARRKYLRGVIDHQNGLQPPVNNTAYTATQDPSPCATDEVQASFPTSADPKKARAVINNDIFTRRPKLLRKNGDSDPIRLTWTIAADPAKDKLASRVPGKWEDEQVEFALQTWGSGTSIEFTKVDASKADTADLVVVFQDINPINGMPYDADDSANRSYCFISRWKAEHVKLSEAALKQPGQVASTNNIATYPLIPHDICFRGIVNTANPTAPASAPRPGKWAPLDRSKRTIVHELGHYFGLAHETLGLWCKMYENVEGKGALGKAAKETNTNATVFDGASVMDELRTDEYDAESLHQWSKLGFKTVFAPSATDISNLALLHAGPHLATLNADKKGFTLINTTAGIPVVSAHGLVLKLSPTLVKDLEDLAKKGEWTAIRTAYLKAQAAQVADMRKLIKTMDATALAAARKAPVVAHGQKAHALTTDLKGPEKAFEAPMPAMKEVLWEKLNQLFGPSAHSTSFLTLQSPARYLDKAEFSYKMEGIYSNFVKPVVVNEAEFRLTDQLFAPARVVGAPNGQNLSTNYDMILNNLVPRYIDADVEIRKAREKMRSWLLEETSSQNAFFVNDTRIIEPKVDGVVGGDEVREAVRNNDALSGPRIASRMEVCQKLMLEYLEASSAWKTKHSKMIQDAMHVQTDGRLQMLEDAARMIANTASVENSKLSAKYADVVVRGHLHTVRECLAQLDIKSVAEFLQDAKDSLRESALSSLYGASRVLPVIMTPMDWAEGLDTTFDPQDLSADPAIIEMNITTKTRQIDLLREQLSSLQHNVKGDEAALRQEMDAASDVYSQAQADLAGKYTESAKLLATRLVKAVSPTAAAGEGIEWVAGTTDTQKSSLMSMMGALDPVGTINDLFDGMNKVETAHRSVMSAGAKFSQRQTDWVRAKSATTAEQEEAVSRKIEAATKELESLQLQLTTAYVAKNKRVALLAKGAAAEEENKKAMAGDDPTKPINLPTFNQIKADASEGGPAAGSRWISVIISSKEAKAKETKSTTTDVSRSDWGVNFFGLAAGGSGDTKNAGTSSTASEASNLDVEISMNCTLVTCDRSSWFQPQFFGMSDSFMKNNNTMKWNDFTEEPTWVKDPATAVDEGIIKGTSTRSVKDSLLPCFPTGYIIAKDVLIKISNFKISTVADKKFLDEKTTSGGSFLFFSTTKTSQKTQDESASAFQMASDGMVVRIPGPQIIAYIQQLLPHDGSHPFKSSESLRPDIFLPGDEDKVPATTTAPADKGRAIGRGLDPNARPVEKKKFTVRSTKPHATADSGETGGSEGSKPGRSQAPNPLGANGHGEAPANGDDHEHNDGEMAHAMKLMTAKLSEKLNEPGFLENLLSGQ